jgi:hypothetical protein
VENKYLIDNKKYSIKLLNEDTNENTQEYKRKIIQHINLTATQGRSIASNR